MWCYKYARALGAAEDDYESDKTLLLYADHISRVHRRPEPEGETQ